MIRKTARDDAAWMRLCLEAALRGRGRVSPNPLVGAAVVKKGRLLALGHHACYGGRHAETVALRQAGRRARGATLYVTLEPCAHQGKTPPCVDEILGAGVARVVAAMRDPHPLVSGRGFRALRAAGLEVTVGVLRSEARDVNEAYLVTLTRGRPLVTLKAGMSLDGRIATARGLSRWLTSDRSRRRAHRMRAEHDAILVGGTTARRDRPLLTVRGSGLKGYRPLRVVLDSDLSLPAGSPILTARGGGPVIIYACRGGPRRRRRLESAGAEVVSVGRSRRGVSIPGVLAHLAGRGIHSLLVEGGGEVAWSFLEAGAVDRVALFVAPILLGGRKSVPVVGGPGAASPAEAIPLEAMSVERIGEDLLVRGRVVGTGAGRGPKSRGHKPLRRRSP